MRQKTQMTDRRRRHEGVRVKHWLNKNSLKFYDKGRLPQRIIPAQCNAIHGCHFHRRPDIGGHSQVNSILQGGPRGRECCFQSRTAGGFR